jgi:hypothetical protein
MPLALEVLLAVVVLDVVVLDAAVLAPVPVEVAAVVDAPPAPEVDRRVAPCAHPCAASPITP